MSFMRHCSGGTDVPLVMMATREWTGCAAAPHEDNVREAQETQQGDPAAH